MGTLVMVTLTHIACSECHAVFGLESRAQERYSRDGGVFYCPYCRVSQCYRDTQVARLERQLAAEKLASERRKAWAEQEARRAVAAEHSARTVRGHMTRLKRRVAAGVCPCCTRTFKDLARHMKGQHPEYAEAPQ